MSLSNSALETKKFYSKDDALLRMIILNKIMKPTNSDKFYFYNCGVFYTADTINLVNCKEWNTNESSPVLDWQDI